MSDTFVERRSLKRRSWDWYAKWADHFLDNHNEIKWPLYGLLAICVLNWCIKYALHWH